MKGRQFLFGLGLISLLSSCSAESSQRTQQELKEEIRQQEHAFQKMLKEQGAAQAFSTFAANDATIKRQNDSLIIGKAAIKNYYSAPLYQNALAEWEPDLIDVSTDGTLAYTFGEYQWHFTDSIGNTNTYRGVFHTVWKRMEDGSWKYVWD